MIRLFLKAKHWHLFALMLGIPLVYQIYFIFQIWGFQTQPQQVTGEGGFTEVLNEEFIQFGFFPYIMIFFTFIFFGWFWSIAIGLQKNIPKGIKRKVKKFKVFFFIPLFHILFSMIYMSGLFSRMITIGFLNSG